MKTLEERTAGVLGCRGYARCFTRFDGGVSHDMRCPARHRHAVLALLRELREECAPKPKHEFCQWGKGGRACSTCGMLRIEAERIRAIGEPATSREASSPAPADPKK